MKEMNWGKFVLVLVILSFVAFPLVGAVDAFLLTQSKVPEPNEAAHKRDLHPHGKSPVYSCALAT